MHWNIKYKWEILLIMMWLNRGFYLQIKDLKFLVSSLNINMVQLFVVMVDNFDTSFDNIRNFPKNNNRQGSP